MKKNETYGRAYKVDNRVINGVQHHVIEMDLIRVTIDLKKQKFFDL